MSEQYYATRGEMLACMAFTIAVFLPLAAIAMVTLTIVEMCTRGTRGTAR